MKPPRRIWRDGEVKGTMHGFDIKLKALTAEAARRARIRYMRRIFNLT